MRQLTYADVEKILDYFSKLPMRQLTYRQRFARLHRLSKLPMRQLTGLITV